MDNNLLRVESAVTATASGDLTWDRWTLDCAVALGIAGKRNPLGFALVRYMTDAPTSTNVWNVILTLAKVLEDGGLPGIKAKDVAWQALDAWNSRHCPRCGGRGVISIEQDTCGLCGGSGERKLDSLADDVRSGVSALLSAESWMEGQLRSLMRRVD